MVLALHMISKALKRNKLIFYKPTLQRLIKIGEDYSSVYLKIFLTYLQIITIMLSFNLDLPLDMTRFFIEFSSININFVFSPSCNIVDLSTTTLFQQMLILTIL